MKPDLERMYYDLDYFLNVVSGKNYEKKEPDTYSLIDKEVYNNVEGCYGVRHNPSGWAIPYKVYRRDVQAQINLLPEAYQGFFEGFLNMSNRERRKWNNQEKKKLSQQEANKPMLTITQESYDYQHYSLKEINDLIDDCSDCGCSECEDHLTDLYYAKGKKMYATSNTAIVAAAQPETVGQRDYLISRLEEVSDKKYDDARTFFKLDPVERPKTLRDLIDQLKSGDYTIDDDILDKKVYNSVDMLYNVRWTKEKSDQAGFEKASDAIREATIKIRDKIKILDPKEGLAALEAFEAQQFH